MGLLVGCCVALYVGGRRVEDWVRQVEANCEGAWPVAPDLTVLGWSAVGMAAVASLCLVVGLVEMVSGAYRRSLKIAAPVIGACVLVLALLLMLAGFTDATLPANRYTVGGSDGGALCPTRW